MQSELCVLLFNCRSREDEKNVVLIKEPDRHFLLDVGTFKSIAKLLEWNCLVAVFVCFEDCALSNAHQLLFTDFLKSSKLGKMYI